jgi:hypothetical protein
MSKFDELFCRLIRENRRIIIPDIGAFITNSSDENTVFSPLLKHNDGFLEEKLQKEGIVSPAVFLGELAENIICVVERRQRYHIAGLGYFYKDGNIRFVFEETEKDTVAGEQSDDVCCPENNGNKNKLRIIWGLICLCVIILVYLLVFVFNIRRSRDRSDMFTFQTEKPVNQFVIVDKSDMLDSINNLQHLPVAKSYHVVAACFDEKDEAEKFVLQCKKIGYNKAEVLSMTDLFYPVSIGAYASQDEALNKKQECDSRLRGNSIILINK